MGHAHVKLTSQAAKLCTYVCTVTGIFKIYLHIEKSLANSTLLHNSFNQYAACWIAKANMTL